MTTSTHTVRCLAWTDLQETVSYPVPAETPEEAIIWFREHLPQLHGHQLAPEERADYTPPRWVTPCAPSRSE